MHLVDYLLGLVRVVEDAIERTLDRTCFICPDSVYFHEESGDQTPCHPPESPEQF